MEKIFDEYGKASASGKALDDELKVASLLKVAHKDLAFHLNLKVTPTTTFNDLKEIIKAYEKAKTKWDTSPTGNPAMPDTPVPMDVDAIVRFNLHKEST